MVEFKLIDNIKDVTNELFSNVIIYIIAEPGAMGFPRLMEFVAESGECFYLVYGNEKGEIPYSIIKSSFRALQDCFGTAHQTTKMQMIRRSSFTHQEIILLLPLKSQQVGAISIWVLATIYA